MVGLPKLRKTQRLMFITAKNPPLLSLVTTTATESFDFHEYMAEEKREWGGGFKCNRPFMGITLSLNVSTITESQKKRNYTN